MLGAQSPPEQTSGKLQTIPLKEIPTSILESLLRVQIERQFGQLTEKDLTSLPLVDQGAEEGIGNCAQRKRTIAEVSNSIDWNEEVSSRESYLVKELTKYGTHDIQPLSTTTENRRVRTSTDEPMVNILKASTIETIKTSIRNKQNSGSNPVDESDIVILDETICEMSQWAGEYIRLLAQRLKRLTEMQRRKIPNRDDARLLMREGFFDANGIHDTYDMIVDYIKIPQNRDKTNALEQKSRVALTAYSGNDEGAFNETNEFMQDLHSQGDVWINRFVQRKKRKAYIPDWMPPFPPDYTYKATPKYNSRVTNPVMLRQQLAKEASLAEKALDHIIIRKDTSIPVHFSEDNISSSDEDEEAAQGEQKMDREANIDHEQKAIISETSTDAAQIPPEKGEDLTQPEGKETIENLDATTEAEDTIQKEDEGVSSERKADLVALANQRMEVLNKRRKQEEERLNKRLNSDESKLGRIFGSYTNMKKLPDGINDELNDYRKKNFISLIRNLHKQEEWTVKWQIEQDALRKKISEENRKYTKENEIQIGMGSSATENGGLAGNIDEDLDFDIDFSDMEDYEEMPPEGGQAKPVSEGKNLTVRFEDEVTTYDREITGRVVESAETEDSATTNQKDEGTVIKQTEILEPPVEPSEIHTETPAEEISFEDYDEDDFAEPDDQNQAPLSSKESDLNKASAEGNNILDATSSQQSSAPSETLAATTSTSPAVPNAGVEPDSANEDEDIDMDMFEE